MCTARSTSRSSRSSTSGPGRRGPGRCPRAGGAGRRAAPGEPAERAPARPRHAGGVEGWLERAREARAAEGIAPRREACVEGLDRQAEALRVQLELLGEILERRPAPPGAR